MTRTNRYWARWIVPVSSSPMAGGVITVSQGRIVAIEAAPTPIDCVDLGDVAIIPGLINAHTHLEYSHLTTPLGQAGLSFADWLRDVISLRRAAGEQTASDVATRRATAVRQGIAESLASGVAAIGDIASPNWIHDWYASDVTVTVFQELLGLSTAQQPHLLTLAEQQVSLHCADHLPPRSYQLGLSPHAPYTARPELVQQLCTVSQQSSVPVAMHLAESFEELELLSAHSGPLVEVLAAFDAWDSAAVPRGIRPLNYLQWLSRAWRALVVHGNFLLAADWQFLAEQRATMSVVYCPRTQAYFDHGEYPLESMLASGVRVAVGTDSRATNPDLSLWKELQFIRQQHPSVSPEDVLQLGTLAGAEALGMSEKLGSLQVGRRAELLAVPLEHPATDWREQLFAGTPQRLRDAIDGNS